MITHVPYPNSLHVLLPTRVRTQSFSPSTKFDTSLHLTTDIPHNYPTRVVPESPALFVFNPKFKKKKKENRKLLHSVKRKFNSFLNFLFVSWEKEMAVGEEPILSRLDRLDNMVSLFSAYNENSKFKLRLKKMILFSFFFFFFSPFVVNMFLCGQGGENDGFWCLFLGKMSGKMRRVGWWEIRGLAAWAV